MVAYQMISEVTMEEYNQTSPQLVTNDSNALNNSAISYMEWFCSDETNMNENGHPLLQPHYIVTIILAIAGIVANVFGICSLAQNRKNQRDCTRARALLLISLSISDIATCVCIPLKFIVVNAMEEQKTLCHSQLTYFCTLTLLDLLMPVCEMISLLNLLGMAIDHWITFIKPFRYFEIMSRKRALIMIFLFWTVSILVVFCEYLTGFKFFGDQGYIPDYFCLNAKADMTYHPEYPVLVVALICLIAMSAIYFSISLEIKKLVASVPPRQQDFGQAKRALRTTYAILLTFLFCWLPVFVMTSTLMIARSRQQKGYYIDFLEDESKVKGLAIAHQWLVALLIVNSVLDPIIYMSHFRLRLRSLCESMMVKVYSKYSIVDTEKRVEIGPSHTMSTMRSSIQISAGGNIMSLEPLCAEKEAQLLI